MIGTEGYKQCTRCVMDTTDPDIVFDEQGYCNHCTDFLAGLTNRITAKQLSASGFDRLIETIRQAGKGKNYDCLLGVSGGVDSSYAAYFLKQLGLRTLLVHMDNGWNAEEAVLNIKNLAEQLAYDYESIVLNWKEFRDLQLSFLKASVVEAETPTDIAILGSLHKVAAKYGIKYIISGGNLATEGILPKYWHYNAKDTRYLKAIHQEFGKVKLADFPFFGFMKEAYYKLFKGIRIVYLLNYIAYDKDEAMELLKKELKWKYYGGKHHESRYTKFVQGYLLPVKFNIEYRKATFSSQICAGRMDRTEALTALELPAYNQATIDGDLDYVAKKLGIIRQELDEIVSQPTKSYKDYPNDEQRLAFLYTLYRKLFTVIIVFLGGSNLAIAPQIIEIV